MYENDLVGVSKKQEFFPVGCGKTSWPKSVEAICLSTSSLILRIFSSLMLLSLLASSETEDAVESGEFSMRYEGALIEDVGCRKVTESAALIGQRSRSLWTLSIICLYCHS